MFNFIEKLRQKPDSVIKQVAFLISFSFVGIIFIFWLFSIYPNFLEEKKIADRVSAVEPSPLSTLSEIISQGTSAMGEQISKIKSLFIFGIIIIVRR
jgi:hypothetical protein